MSFIGHISETQTSYCERMSSHKLLVALLSLHILTLKILFCEHTDLTMEPCALPCISEFYYGGDGLLDYNIPDVIASIYLSPPKNHSNCCSLKYSYIHAVSHFFRSQNLTVVHMFELVCSPELVLMLPKPEGTQEDCMLFQGIKIIKMDIVNCSLPNSEFNSANCLIPSVTKFLYNVELKQTLKERSNIRASNATVPCINTHLHNIQIFPTGYNSTPEDDVASALAEEQRYSVPMCIRCSIDQRYSDIIKGLTRIFSSCSYEEMYILRLYNYDLSRESVHNIELLMTKFPNICYVALQNCNMTSIPNINFSSQLKLKTLEENPFDWGVIEKYKIHRLSRFDAPVSYFENYRYTTLHMSTKRFVLRSLTLRYNNIYNLKGFPASQYIDELQIGHNYIKGQSLTSLKYYKNLHHLELSGNPLSFIPNGTVDLLTKLEVLELMDCQLKDFRQVDWRRNHILSLLVLDRNQITSLEDMFQNLESLTELFAPSNHVVNLRGLYRAGNLELISLMDNYISDMEPSIATSRNLKYVTLRYNNLTADSFHGFLDSSSYKTVSPVKPGGSLNRQIDMASNCITHLPIDTLERLLTLDTILETSIFNLYDNPLRCGCVEYKQQLQSQGLQNWNQIKCEDSGMQTRWFKQIFTRTVKSYGMKRKCNVMDSGGLFDCKAGKMKLTAMVSVVSIVLFIILTFLCYFKHQGIARSLKYFLVFCFRLDINTIRKCCVLNKDRRYDVFIAYSSKDMAWVNALIERLEKEVNPPLHVCYHERDFTVGVDVTVNIFNNMAASKCVLLVVTPNFVQSEWCRFEFFAALYEMRVHKKGCYLVTILSDHSNLRTLPHDLIKYIKRSYCLCLTDRHLWYKLLLNLPYRKGICLDGMMETTV